MFKRVEKRLKRKEREDELGLDEDMKDVLGLNDTDSDESDSDSDDGSAQTDLSGIDQDENGDEDEEAESHVATDNELEEVEDEDNTERALVSISEAQDNPIFIISLDPDTRECIVCPGRYLKGITMVDKHISSNAHERRFKRFQKLAVSANPKSSAQALVKTAMGEKGPQTTPSSEISKRTEKKRITQEKRRAKRQKFKARQKAKREAKKEVQASADPVEPDGKEIKSKKKRKFDETKQVKEESRKANIDLKGHENSPSHITPVQPAEAKNSKSRDAHDASKPPRKKQKTSTSPLVTAPSPTPTVSPFSQNKKRSRLVPPTATKTKSQPTSDHGDPETVQKLQSQVKDIIKSASSLAKAARLRALGGDDDGERKPSKGKKHATTKAKSQKP